MRFGPNIKCVGAFAITFFAAQGMVFSWGYQTGYHSGHREGYGDVFVEAHNKMKSDEHIAAEAAAALTAAPTPPRPPLPPLPPRSGAMEVRVFAAGKPDQ